MKRAVTVAIFAVLLLAPAIASAFCGFYVGGSDAALSNDATQVVLMREGTRTVLSMQNAYKGPPENFALVIPVPIVLQSENVKTLPMNVFEHIDALTAPRLVEYWEKDPCASEAQPPPMPPTPAPAGAARTEEGKAADLGVKAEARFTVGEYEIVILSAQDSSGLDTWLRQEKYTIPDGAEPYLRPYVAAGSKFFVARVDITKVQMKDGAALLSPIRFHYDSDDFRLPVRLGLINSSGAQDLIVHILARGTRYQAANYPNVTIPTNLDVSETAMKEFGTFYTTLFDRTIAKTPKAVVTEYAWEPTSCDPCPGPGPLAWSEMSTFGMDVLPSAPFHPRAGKQFVLTRLHARYTKDSLGEDLVFREASPIIGGREVYGGSYRVLETGAQTSSYNNFQARYAVRHPWTGPITCKMAVRGRWGGPPNAESSKPPPATATKLGLVEHKSRVDLGAFLKSDVPEIDFSKANGNATTTVNDTDDPNKRAGSKGCGGGCALGTEGGRGGGVAALALLALLTLRRRHRRA